MRSPCSRLVAAGLLLLVASAAFIGSSEATARTLQKTKSKPKCAYPCLSCDPKNATLCTSCASAFRLSPIKTCACPETGKTVKSGSKTECWDCGIKNCYKCEKYTVGGMTGSMCSSCISGYHTTYIGGTYKGNSTWWSLSCMKCPAKCKGRSCRLILTPTSSKTTNPDDVIACY